MTAVGFWIPGGRTRIITVAATAGNVATQIKPIEAENRLHLVTGRITLVADATVASRVIYLTRLYNSADTATTIDSALGSAAVTASQTGSVAYGPVRTSMGGGVQNFASHGIDWQHCYVEKTGISGDPTDMCFHLYVNNGVVGDSYSGYLVFKEVPC